MTECYCTDEGPCELHMEVLASRDGAALHTFYVWWNDGYVIGRITGGPLDVRERYTSMCAIQRFDGSAGPCDCGRDDVEADR